MSAPRSDRYLDERGAAFVLVVILLALTMAAAALAVDVGLLATARWRMVRTGFPMDRPPLLVLRIRVQARCSWSGGIPVGA